MCKQAYGRDLANFMRGLPRRGREGAACPCGACVFPAPYREGLQAMCSTGQFLADTFHSGEPTEVRHGPGAQPAPPTPRAERS